MRNMIKPILKASRHGMFAHGNQTADKTSDHFMAAAVCLGFVGFQYHDNRKKVDAAAHPESEASSERYKP